MGWTRRIALAVIAAAALTAAMVAPAHANPPNVIEQEAEVGFFYGTFFEQPNTFMVVGGPAEAFCESNPEDPFGGTPGTGTEQIRQKADGSTEIRLLGSVQEVYLYEADVEGAPPWIFGVCETYFATGEVPTPSASGLGWLNAKVTIGTDGEVDIFNRTRALVVDEHGQRSLVWASADFTVVDGVPDADPSEFVSFKMWRTCG